MCEGAQLHASAIDVQSDDAKVKVRKDVMLVSPEDACRTPAGGVPIVQTANEPECFLRMCALNDLRHPNGSGADSVRFADANLARAQSTTTSVSS